MRASDEGEELGGFVGMIVNQDTGYVDVVEKRKDALECDDDLMTIEELLELENQCWKKLRGQLRQSEVGRPQRFSEFVGNQDIVGMLQREIAGAQEFRGGQMRNTLLYGAAGLGKTTLAEIVARETEAVIFSSTGSALKRPEDMARAILTLKMESGITGKPAILFIDEIHEVGTGQQMGEAELLPLFERGIFHCPSIKTATIHDSTGVAVQVEVGGRIEMSPQPFTVIGATTDPQMLTAAMRRRFPCQCFLRPYRDQDIEEIIRRYAVAIDVPVVPEVCRHMASRARANPARAISLVDSCLNRSAVTGKRYLDMPTALAELNSHGIEERGLSAEDLLILRALRDCPRTSKGARGGLSLSSLAAVIGMSGSMVQEMLEPYLKQLGLMIVTSKRQITDKGLVMLDELEARPNRRRV